MVQQERVKRSPAATETIPETTTKRPRSTPWLVGALVGMTVALLALGGWTLYQRSLRSDAEGLAQNAVAAWDSGRPAALAEVYDPAAVLVDATGAKIVGTDAIAAALADRGSTFTVTPVGGITATSDGTYATTSYRFSGDGQGVGISVIQIADGKIVRQWTFEPIAAPTPPSK
jgi:hypothetical protein